MNSLHYLLMKSHSMLQRQIRSQAAVLGLSAGQPKILEYLFLFGEANQKSIAEHCEIEAATVGNLLLRMEKSGLILRSSHNGDRRALYVSLTEAGSDAAGQMSCIFEEEERKATACMSPEECLQLQTLLEKFCQSAEQKEAGMS